MSTIKDVALKAGVSFTTVSHVINGTRKVSEITHQRVMQAIKECAYVPSQVARSLQASQTHVIGLLVPDISNPFCAEITQGIEQVAQKQGFAIMLYNHHQQTQTQQFDDLLSRRVDGVILLAGIFQHSFLAPALQKKLAHHRLPLVLIDHEPQDIVADSLLSDAFESGRMATQHLIDLGHQKIACISGPLNMPVSQARVDGWKSAMQQLPNFCYEQLLFEGSFNIASGVELAKKILTQTQCSAVFACNDMMALGVLTAASYLNVQVPQKLSVIGVDGIAMGQYASPALTTVGKDLIALGAQAANLLISRIKNQITGGNLRVMTQSNLILRQSTTSFQA